jgi:hypothetical protein
MPELPLARIKKIMKSEDEIKSDMNSQKFMISAEAPVMFAKVIPHHTHILSVSLSLSLPSLMWITE